MFPLQTKNVTKALTTFVVSASISDTSIQNLADPVVITLQHVGGNQVRQHIQFHLGIESPQNPSMNFLLNVTGYLTDVILRLNEDCSIPDSREVW